MKYIFTLLATLIIPISNLHANALLDQIKQAGVISIGTTGDYPPLSAFDKTTNQYNGFAIDMAKSLAKELGVKVKFVHTRWQTLATDLANNKFDIAMGGITITKSRKKNLYSAHLS